MNIRPTIIISGTVAIGVIALVIYFWTAEKEGGPASVLSETGVPSESASGEAATGTPGTETGESLETIMQEIERDAAGDDQAMENELAGESESFMEGAVVMEQLGQSYDETNY